MSLASFLSPSQDFPFLSQIILEWPGFGLLEVFNGSAFFVRLLPHAHTAVHRSMKDLE
jgi:hypothetical protein